jgi:hypothetical protein
MGLHVILKYNRLSFLVLHPNDAYNFLIDKEGTSSLKNLRYWYDLDSECFVLDLNLISIGNFIVYLMEEKGHL